MKAQIQIKIGSWTAIGTIFVLVLLPSLILLIVCHLVQESLWESLRENFIFFYFLMAYGCHLPLLVLLAVYSCVVKRGEYKTVAGIYWVLFIGFVLSGLYFYLLAFPDPQGVLILPRLVPSVVYVIIMPLLAQGVWGRAKGRPEIVRNERIERTRLS